ncbi:hypothetical protein [uncultured Fibrobacter sp.]|jgi:hypothetical protein|uniref:hypothetical protein n=1 Tax=uncultured Fibrobacter sp. TaxID=261512 RepID=UPI001564D16C|nr:hypothetical protein [uncultured Fibrobacter sp.]
MFYKHWKKILLSLCAMLWSGCSDDSSSDNPSTGNKLIACDLEQMCPEYGILYDCENEEDKIAGNYENCTMSYPSCSNVYYCEDRVNCWEYERDGEKSYDCHDRQENSFELTEDEFKSKYYVERERIH